MNRVYSYNMNYICLAAGKGTRFNGLGVYLQKCMYPVAGFPFLYYSLENLFASTGFHKENDRLILVVGHLGNQIRAYFGDSFREVPLHYVEQSEAAGTGHAVLRAYQEYPFEESAVVWLADTYVEAGQFDAIRNFRETAALTVAHHVCAREHGERITFGDDGLHIARAWEGTDEYVEIGLWKVPAEVLVSMLEHKADEYRYLPVIDNAIRNGLRVAALHAKEWVHLGGTEPNVIENLRYITGYLMRKGET